MNRELKGISSSEVVFGKPDPDVFTSEFSLRVRGKDGGLVFAPPLTAEEKRALEIATNPFCRESGR